MLRGPFPEPSFDGLYSTVNTVQYLTWHKIKRFPFYRVLELDTQWPQLSKIKIAIFPDNLLPACIALASQLGRKTSVHIIQKRPLKQSSDLVFHHRVITPPGHQV